MIARIRTYTGLHSMMHKLDRLVSEFQFSTMADVHALPVPVPATADRALAVYA
jgi:hypothetical protein